MSLISMLEDSFSKYQNAPAITDKEGERTLTYGQLDDLAGRCASKLRSAGIGAGDRVIVRMGRKTEYIAAELAILRLNAVVIPVLPAYPDDRIQYIMEDAGAQTILDESFFDDIESFPVLPVQKEIEEEQALGGKIDFIFYTSGSTGNPKGVIFTDSVMTEIIFRNQEDVENAKPIVFGAFANFSFVASITEYYITLYLGGHTHMLSDAMRTDVRGLEDYYKEHHITVCFMPPRVLKVYQNKDPELQYVIEGGEKSSEIYSSEYQIINCYAQTETGLAVLSLRVDKKYPNTPLGTPKKGISISIRDDNGKEVADGEEGMLFVTGKNMPYEYLNLPELTAKTFTVHEDGLITVRTGDRVKKLPDGNVIYVNRDDWMLKIHGQRVEPGEIETGMCRVEGVTGAVAKAFDLEDGTTILCGFYTQEGDKSKEEMNSAIMQALSEKLPPYMIPTVLVKLDSIPLNANGKIDRKAIEMPDLGEQLLAYEKPEGPVEEAITLAMEKILCLPRVGRKDDFFFLGGNSLNAVNLAHECGIDSVTPQIVMMGRTAEGIARLLKEDSPDRPLIQKSTSLKNRYPLSLSMRFQYDCCAFHGKPIDYFDLCYYYVLDSGIDEERLKNAIRETVKDYPIYWIGVDIEKNEMFFREDEFDVPTLSLDAEAFRAFREERNLKIRDLKRDPLFEAVIFHSEGKTFLLLYICHLIYDGASFNLFLKTVEGKYERSQTPEEDFSVFDLAETEQKTRETSFYQKAEQFFSDYYANLEQPAFFEDKMESTAISVPLISRELEDQLDGRAKELGVSILSLFLGAFEITVKKTQGKEDFCVQCVHSGRTEAGLQNTQGALAKAVYLRSEKGRSGSLKDFLMSIQNQYQNLVMHDVCDIPELLRKYPSVRSGFSFNYIGSEEVMVGIRLGGKEYMIDFDFYDEFLKSRPIFTKFDFIMGRYPNFDGLRTTIATAGMTKEDAEAFLDMYVSVLKKLVTEDDLRNITQ